MDYGVPQFTQIIMALVLVAMIWKLSCTTMMQGFLAGNLLFSCIALAMTGWARIENSTPCSLDIVSGIGIILIAILGILNILVSWAYNKSYMS